MSWILLLFKYSKKVCEKELNVESNVNFYPYCLPEIISTL